MHSVWHGAVRDSRACSGKLLTWDAVNLLIQDTLCKLSLGHDELDWVDGV